MEPLFTLNGLMFWTEREIRLRQQMAEHIQFTLREALLAINPAWRFVQIEAPILTPRDLLNPNYSDEDIWAQDSYEDRQLALRPETTPGSYLYAQHLLNSHSGYRLPLVVWQAGKSFRREADHVIKNMRLKEFWQQEFQCIYAADTANDYHSVIQPPVQKMIGELIGVPTRIVPSDRLPVYSQITSDVEAFLGDRWMEVCSISRRTDFPQKIHVQQKSGVTEKEVLVLEVAVGLCRLVYCFNQRQAMLYQ